MTYNMIKLAELHKYGILFILLSPDEQIPITTSSGYHILTLQNTIVVSRFFGQVDIVHKDYAYVKWLLIAF